MIIVTDMNVRNQLSQPAVDACTEPDAASVAAARDRMIAGGTAGDLASLFKALGDPTRVRILSALLGAEVCVNDLAAALGMGQSAVSHQLSYLRELRLVTVRREGKHVFYRLDDDHVHGLLAQGLDHVTHG